jgi:hypothetical protein
MAEAGVIHAGLAAVQLTADVAPLAAGLSKAKSLLTGYASGVAKMGVALGGMGSALAAPIIGLFKGAVDQATGMGDLASKMGTTADEASRLTYAMSKYGMTQEEVVGFSQRMSKALVELREGVPETTNKFAQMGVFLGDLEGKDLTGMFEVMGTQINKIVDPTDKFNRSLEYLSANGPRTLKAFEDGSKGLREGMEESDRVGATVTQQQVEDARKIAAAFKVMSTGIKSALLEVGKALFGSGDDIQELASNIADVARDVRTFIQENKQLIKIVLGVGAAVAVAGGALVALGVAGGALSGLVAGLGAAVVAVKFLALALIGLTGFLIGLAVPLAIPAALLYLFVTRTEAGAEAMRRFGSVTSDVAANARTAWGNIKDAAVDAWGGIVSALKRGDIESAWEIALAGLKVIWQEVRIFISSSWRSLINMLRETVDDVAVYLGTVFINIGERIAVALGSAITGVRGMFAGLARVMGGLLEGVRAMAGAIVGMVTSALAGVTDMMAGVLRRVGGTTAAELAGLSGRMTGMAAALEGVGAKGRAAASAIKGEAGATAEAANRLARTIEGGGDTGEERARERGRQMRKDLREWRDVRKTTRDKAAADDRAAARAAADELKDELGGLLESEEYKTWERGMYNMLMAEVRAAGPGRGGGGMAAPREARGMFTAGLVGGSVAQALGAGTQPVLRDLLGEARKTNDHLADIAGKVEPPVVGN